MEHDKMRSTMKERLRAALPFLGFLICPAVTMILTELYLYNPFTDIKPAPWLLNFIFYWLTAAFLVMLTGRLRAALRIQTAFFMLAGLANYYVVAFRSSPILPWDIFSIGTAATVADNFSYTLPGRVWFVLAGFAALLLAEQLFPCRIRAKRVRLAGGCASVLLLMGFTFMLHQESVISGLRLYDKMFTPGVVQKRNGCAVAFAMELKYLVVERPRGYDAAACGEKLAAYGAEEENEAAADSISAANAGNAVMEGVNAANGGGTKTADGAQLPNIIVIMDEAFADMADVGSFVPNRDALPFFHSMEGAENTISGRMHVSVLGGNTANTEFEFLTGNTMAFLPQGSIPYQQYIRGDLPALPSYLKGAGYQSVAMHPYHASGWCRDKVYPWMGFGEMRFIEDYQDAAYVRKYVSDQSDFDHIITEYERRDPEKPLFLFNVTMQNHGGYDQEYDNFTSEIMVDGIKSQALSNYLSLVSLTDEALSDLVAYFEQEQEPVMIVFFGDHQPNDTVAGPILRANGTGTDDLTPEQETARYQVPFLIWANYDIEEKSGVETSANYLALEVLDAAGIPRNGYYGYLEELRESLPVVSARQIRTADGAALTDEERKGSPYLEEYKEMQYYQLFDAEK